MGLSMCMWTVRHHVRLNRRLSTTRLGILARRSTPRYNLKKMERKQVAEQLFIVRRMDLVPKLCADFVCQLLLVFAYIVALQACKHELALRQVVVAWLALSVYVWTLCRQVYRFLLAFQRMVANSKIESKVSSSEHEFVLLQAATCFVGAAWIFLKTRGTETTVFYLVWVLAGQSLTLLANALLIFQFNQAPNEQQVD
jgi:hypothetical protein